MHPSLSASRCTLASLSKKSVVNLCDGSILGGVCDLEFDCESGRICALIVPGPGLFGSVSAKNRAVIPWRDIECIGEETVLVRYTPPPQGLKPEDKRLK